MTRQLTITPAEWASVQDGHLWLMREGTPYWGGDDEALGYQPKMIPPVEFVQASAPCETCHDKRGWDGHVLASSWVRCPDCRIELVGPCQNCPTVGKCAVCGDNSIYTNGTVVLGHAYTVGSPLMVPPPPDHMADELSYTCDWGHCDELTAAWRWRGQWLPVCEGHSAQVGPPSVGMWGQRFVVTQHG